MATTNIILTITKQKIFSLKLKTLNLDANIYSIADEKNLIISHYYKVVKLIPKLISSLYSIYMYVSFFI
jgi:hypothetical protein